MTKKVQLAGLDCRYYSLADSCKILNRARSTLMRLLPSWEKVTKSKPVKDHSGRWFLTVKSVHALRDNSTLYLKLSGRATKWEAKVAKLTKENKRLKAKLRKLEDKHGTV